MVESTAFFFGLVIRTLEQMSETNLICLRLTNNKIRDLFKVKLYKIRSETKEREKEREKYLLTLALTGGS